MISIAGQWQDGQTSQSTDAHLLADESGWLRINSNASLDSLLLADGNISDVVISDRLGNIPRTLRFEGTGTFTTNENEAIDLLQKRHNAHNWLRHVAILESKLHVALACLVILIGLAIVTYTHGIPIAAKHVANQLPDSLVKKVEDFAIGELGTLYFDDSQLPEKRQNQLRDYFQQYDVHQRQILFKKSDILGANAFALPYSTIIFTDEMVELAKHDEELLAIYFHETGHIKHKHGTRSVLQASALVVLFAFFAGDSSGIAESIYAIPAFLMHNAYSRHFELEADDYAYDTMLQQKIPLHRFADIMQRLEASHHDDSDVDAEVEEKLDAIESYISTHPLTKERVERFK